MLQMQIFVILICASLAWSLPGKNVGKKLAKSDKGEILDLSGKKESEEKSGLLKINQKNLVDGKSSLRTGKIIFQIILNRSNRSGIKCK